MAMSCEQIQDLIDPKGYDLVSLEGENLDDITPSIPNNEIWHTSANGWSEYANAIVGYDF